MAKILKNTDSINKNVESLNEETRALNDAAKSMISSFTTATKLQQSSRDILRSYVKEQKKALEDEAKQKKKLSEEEERRKEIARARDRKYAEWEEQNKRQLKQHLKDIQKLKEETGKADIEQYRALQEEEKKLQDLISNKSKGITSKIASSKVGQIALNAGNQLFGEASTAIDNALEQFRGYTSNIATRLSGNTDTFNTMVGRVSEATAFNGAVSASSVVNNLNALVSSGIAYNVELRAYLATATDKIATTFDVFDSNLLRLIRLQKHDTTAAYMGMEATLTDLFNETFKDTSFLNKGGLSDAITGSILEATSQMGYSEGLEFQYSVQKWLGALSESGASDSFVSTLANALNMLGTGDVNGLANNSQMQSLLALAANNAGLNYSDLLIGGLNATNTNTLMYSLLNYLGNVSSVSSGNNVLRNAFGNVFGFGMSDVRAIQNLLSGQASTIYNSSLSYGGAEGKTSSQLQTMLDRTSVYDRINTTIDNMLYNIGSAVATNELFSGLWTGAGLLEKLLGNPKIAGVDIFKLAKLGIAGFGGGGQALLNAFSAMGAGGTDSLGLSGLQGILSGGGNQYVLGDNTFDGSNLMSLKTISGISVSDTKNTNDIYEQLSEVKGDTNKIDTNTKRGTTQNAPVYVVDMDRTELLNTIIDNANTLKENTFDVNIKSVSGDTLLPVSLSDATDTMKAFYNLDFAKNIAQRIINAVYNADANNVDPQIDTEHTIGALAEFLVNVQSARGDYIDVNLADSSLTIKDMLVRRS